MVNRQISQGKKDKFFEFSARIPWQKSNKNSSNLKKGGKYLRFFCPFFNLLTKKQGGFFAFFANTS